ncbi:hypothetical protein CDD80_1065 [Ophiocordyceps camponoti-rufipedis]|uniref:RGS domain-containing protein n=1 Tax=Ophiocordyceps camponoti-rufipedis TaxID=2004952 RepID=A0A2C5ZL37_9HYPO|nr:hypothetical protein CDD80_1065 [Ophiocordyceps camponoti-rufipedis]
MDHLTVYTLPTSPPRWDRVGVFYMSFGASWTALVVAGMAFCLYHRRNPILRLRGLGLSFGAISLLHVYWILAQIVYPVASTVPIVLAYDIQYFVMGMYFPLGIALFHASNSRFLHVAKLQMQFTQGAPARKPSVGWFASVPYMVKLMTVISLGMIVQVIACVGMWLLCRKYHPTFGLLGTEMQARTLPAQIVELGRGWEWWPSVLWQLIWAWIVAPVLIWRAWGIRDTMGWRTQTIGCCLSNLHATPMFLIASYVPAFAPVNVYFAPSQWIHLSIFMFEIFTVFVPAFEVVRLGIQKRRVANLNAKWDAESTTSTLTPGDWRKRSTVHIGGDKSRWTLDEELGDRLLSMAALEHVLASNPGPLQEFSALSDFSGENIAFLTRTASWKSSWTDAGEQRLEVYNSALEIYANFVSPRDAEFPLNLSSAKLRRLEAVFEIPTRILYGEARTDLATPFADDAFGPGQSRLTAQYTGEIPDGFGPDVFEEAIQHIKSLVLTNTWPKFIDEMQSPRRKSTETTWTGISANSQSTLASRLSKQISRLMKKQ